MGFISHTVPKLVWFFSSVVLRCWAWFFLLKYFHGFLEKKNSVCILLKDISMVLKPELPYNCSLVVKSAQNLLPTVCFLSAVFCFIFPAPTCSTDNPSRIFLGSALDYFMVNLLKQIPKFPLSSQCCSWSQSRLSLLTFPRSVAYSAANSIPVCRRWMEFSRTCSQSGSARGSSTWNGSRGNPLVKFSRKSVSKCWRLGGALGEEVLESWGCRDSLFSRTERQSIIMKYLNQHAIDPNLKNRLN